MLRLRALGFRLLALHMSISRTLALFMMVMTCRRRGEKDSPALGKSESSKIFHEVVNLIIGFFPHAKLDSPSSSTESFPWRNVVNMAQQCDPCIFLTLFKWSAAVSKEVSEKFKKAADGKKTLSALPCLGQCLPPQ